MTNLSTIGKRIRFCRVSCEYSQSKLGDLIGYSQKRISEWEHDDRITLDIIVKIATITGYPVSFILGINDND